MSERNPKFAWVTQFLASGVRPASCITVGLTIADQWNGDNTLPYASVRYLAKTTKSSEMTVKRALVILQSEGWVAQAKRGRRTGTKGTASTWRLTIPNRPLLTVPTDHFCSPTRPIELDPLVTVSPDLDPWNV